MSRNVLMKDNVKTFSMVIRKEGKEFVAWNPDLDIADFGDTIEEAKKNLEDAIKFHLKNFDEKLPETSFMGILSTDIKVPAHVSHSC